MEDLDEKLHRIIDNFIERVATAEGEDGRLFDELKQLIVDRQIAAVEELKRRWDNDRKTMDYSPATYMFICDKYINELKSLKEREK